MAPSEPFWILKFLNKQMTKSPPSLFSWTTDRKFQLPHTPGLPIARHTTKKKLNSKPNLSAPTPRSHSSQPGPSPSTSPRARPSSTSSSISAMEPLPAAKSTSRSHAPQPSKASFCANQSVTTTSASMDKSQSF